VNFSKTSKEAKLATLDTYYPENVIISNVLFSREEQVEGNYPGCETYYNGQDTEHPGTTHMMTETMDAYAGICMTV